METQEYKKMVLFLFACVGAEEYEFYNVAVGTTENELSAYAWDRALEFAECYGIYPEYQRPEEEEDESDFADEYSDDISGHWEEYDPKKHDGHTIAGVPKWGTLVL